MDNNNNDTHIVDEHKEHIKQYFLKDELFEDTNKYTITENN